MVEGDEDGLSLANESVGDVYKSRNGTEVMLQMIPNEKNREMTRVLETKIVPEDICLQLTQAMREERMTRSLPQKIELSLENVPGTSSGESARKESQCKECRPKKDCQKCDKCKAFLCQDHANI
ncbi:hypothetical protein ANN_06547 [Periplaneta americana]|uniref:Uncharacterized protein n=1 Tax=Periplaneta americana TaxID=6978 RepID=A0ABQ8TGC8_PERAM|nr:hypothetical protein ANN_06547 [Periplaneta americana]